MAQNPGVRVIANINSKIYPTVNIVASGVQQAGAGQAYKTYTQMTAAQAAAAPGVFGTVQAAPTTTPGLKTIVIPGYSGPN